MLKGDGQWKIFHTRLLTTLMLKLGMNWLLIQEKWGCRTENHVVEIGEFPGRSNSDLFPELVILYFSGASRTWNEHSLSFLQYRKRNNCVHKLASSCIQPDRI